MKNKIKVTVIMPVYNSGVYLQTAVDSILSQSLKDIELILVDDGSTDGSSEKCDEYAKKDKRVVVIHQKNGGICNARNAALTIAKGEYIGFSDHDDEYVQGFLEAAYNKAIETDVDLVKVSKKVLVTLDGAFVKERSNRLPEVIWGQAEIKEHYFDLFTRLKINCVWDSLFKASFIKENNLWFDEFYKCGGEDYDFMARYLPYIKSLAMMPEQFYKHYVRNGVSTSSKYNSYKLVHTKRLVQVIYNNAYKLGIKPETNIDFSNFFLTEFYVNCIAALLMHKGCRKSLKEKIRIMMDLSKAECMNHGFYLSSSIKLFRKSSKIGLSYFFYKHGWIKVLLLMHLLRNIQQNSHILNR